MRQKARRVLQNLRPLSQMRRRRAARVRPRLCPAGALAIGGFVRSRWLFAVDAGELWGLVGSWSIGGSDRLAGAGFQQWGCSINGAEWTDVARFGGGLKALIRVGRRGRAH